jgi:uncharacterized protein
MKIAAFLLLAGCATAPSAPAPKVTRDAQEIAAWRASREARLRAPDGWLSVVGLFWLPEGESRFGSAADNDIVFPAGPPRAGSFERHGRAVTIHMPPQAAARPLASDAAGEPTVVTLDRLSFYVIERGERVGIRLRDPESPARKAFRGLDWYPIDPAYRVTARFEPYPDHRQIQVPNVLGDLVPMDCPGRAVFTLHGQALALDGVLEEPDAKELMFIFADGTTERTTYPGGRFLYTELPRDGAVVLDFNKAYSPPCAFTDSATCPVPPKQNRLVPPIEAGEKWAAH